MTRFLSLLSLLAVLLLASLASAQALVGNFIIHMPVPPSGSEDITIYVYNGTGAYGPYNGFTAPDPDGQTYVYDEESDLYVSTTTASTWSFAGGTATHTWPLPVPQVGFGSRTGAY